MNNALSRYLGYLGNRQAAKNAHFDNSSLPFMQRCQLLKLGVKCRDVK